MLADKDRIFRNLYGQHDWGLKGARARGAWDGTKAILAKGRDAIIEEVKTSGLRGRGGAGFPTGLKWSFMPKKSDGRPHYLVVNADESEPGTCKDREIMRHDPHLLVEGCLIAGFAMGANAGYIYVRGEFIRERERLQAAIDEAYEAKLIGKNNVQRLGFRSLRSPRRRRLYLRRRNRAAGKPGRQEGPAAAEAAVPGQCRPLRLPDHRAERRIDRGRARTSCGAAHHGSPASAGRTIPAPSCSAFPATSKSRATSKKPWAFRCASCWKRMPAACAAAGTICSRSFRAARRCRWCPAGKDQADTLLMDFDGCRDKKSALGTAAVIVMDKSTDIVRAMARISYFYKHESCGQCTPCREGMGWMWRVLTRMAEGRAQKREIDMLMQVTQQIEGHTICAFGDGAAWPVQGLLRHFRPEIERRIDEYSRNADAHGAVREAAE